MSEQASERPLPARRDNVFTRKIGPLPMWVWVVIIGGAILAYSFYKNKTAGSTSSATGTSASQVPEFVNQVYTNPTAPVAGPPGAPGPQGPPGPPGPGPVPVTRPPAPPPITGNVYHPPGMGGGGTPQVRSERLRNRGNLEQIAKRNGLDVEDLLKANPELRKYQGTGRQLPVGTVIRIPAPEGSLPGRPTL